MMFHMESRYYIINEGGRSRLLLCCVISMICFLSFIETHDKTINKLCDISIILSSEIELFIHFRGQVLYLKIVLYVECHILSIYIKDFHYNYKKEIHVGGFHATLLPFLFKRFQSFICVPNY